MARRPDLVVDRPFAHGRRTTGAGLPQPMRERLQREALERELGLDRMAGPARPREDHDEGLLALLTHPVALAILTLLAFAAIFTAMLWRDGAFDHWLIRQGAAVERGSRGWMLGKPGTRAEEPQLPGDAAQKLEDAYRGRPAPPSESPEPDEAGDEASTGS